MQTTFRFRLATALAAVLAACERSTPSHPAVGTSEQPFVYGVSFNVTVNVLAPSGTVTSTDGQIRCGSGPDATLCTGKFDWNVQAVLVATADPSFMFGTWGGDCSGRTVTDASGKYLCVLDTVYSGSDKEVNAIFGPIGNARHGNFTSPAVHGPEYLDWVAGRTDAFYCTNCHGATYDGMGTALSCNACHALPASGGWVTWRTNCTFCHGTRTATYGAESLVRASPPDSVAQRLSGTPAPERTGRHRSHLLGRPAFPAFACGTCHAVPSSVEHIRLDRRAPVVFDPASAFPGLSAGELAALPSPLADYKGSSSPPTCGANYCHGATLSGGRAAAPAWSSAAPAVTDCTSCHGAPPETGRTVPADDVYCLSDCSVHAWHVQALPVLGYESCDACHHGSALGNAAALHVNGRVDVAFSAGIAGSWDPVAGTCATACHSDPAPRSWR